MVRQTTIEKRKLLKPGCALSVLIGCIFLLLLGLFINRFNPPILPPEVATTESPAMSFTGKYELSVKLTEDPPGVRWLNFEVQNISNGTVFIPEERFAARHTTFFLWDKDDRIWVYSGDIGTYIWAYDPNKMTWTKEGYGDSDIPVPPFLKEVRPKYFSMTVTAVTKK